MIYSTGVPYTPVNTFDWYLGGEMDQLKEEARVNHDGSPLDDNIETEVMEEQRYLEHLMQSHKIDFYV